MASPHLSSVDSQYGIGLSRHVATVLALLACSSLVADSESESSSLTEEQEALYDLLSACEKIEDEETQQRCYEIALADVDDESAIPDLKQVFEKLGIEYDETESEQEEKPTPDGETTNEDVAKADASTDTEPKKRGLFGRIARAVTSPIRAVLPSGDENDADKTDAEQDQTDTDTDEESRGTTSWEAVVVRTGRIDRNVHLVLLDDGKLFEYITPANLRFRKNDSITVTHIDTWMTEDYRLDGPRGPIQDALLIPCHREDKKGNVKRKCKLMGID